MIVVDNFRTVLLVGLISTVWISPTFAADEKCKDSNGADAPCPDDGSAPFCHINPDGVSSGCVAANPSCPDGVTDALVCGDSKGCCCKAGAAPCNDMTDGTVKTTACNDPGIKAKPPCADGSGVTGGSVSSSEGPTDGGGNPPAPSSGNKCKVMFSADNTTDVGSCPKACETKTDGSGFTCIEMCEEDKCGDNTCCCKSEEKECTITLSTGSSLASLGSLQVVTLVAAALYFFPIKTSS